MFIDKLLQVSDHQAVTESVASTHHIDFGQKNPDTGMDDRSKMVITVHEAPTAQGNVYITFLLQDSADGINFRDVLKSDTFLWGDLPAGSQVVLPMPLKLRRWCQLYYEVQGGKLKTGSFSAQIVAGIQQNVPHPDSPRIV